jgi:hypothetical protein
MLIRAPYWKYSALPSHAFMEAPIAGTSQSVSGHHISSSSSWKSPFWSSFWISWSPGSPNASPVHHSTQADAATVVMKTKSYGYSIGNWGSVSSISCFSFPILASGVWVSFKGYWTLLVITVVNAVSSMWRWASLILRLTELWGNSFYSHYNQTNLKSQVKSNFPRATLVNFFASNMTIDFTLLVLWIISVW